MVITGEQKIEQLIAEMTPAEKIGQMTQVSNDSISPAEVTEFAIGSVLSGGNGNPTPNTPSVWKDMVGSFVDAATDTRLGVPLLYGVDAVHGHSNVGGATIFPHNIGLGASGNENLVRRIGRATAAEMLATGVRWTFAPTVAVPQDIRWGRTYEGYGRDPELVARLGAALVTGLQEPDSRVLGCAKHFVGDGGTSWGTVQRAETPSWWDGWGENWQIDQGDTRISEEALRTTHLLPYAAAVDAGALTVMASYNSWNGEKLHAHRRLLTDVLKGELGFSGFVVSDWMGVDQVATAYEDAVIAAINAGIDMVMVPLDFHRFVDVMLRATSTGAIPMDRIDDAVRRILRAKSFAHPSDSDPNDSSLSVIGCEEHRTLAAEAVRRSAVLLKNEGALPLPADLRSIAVAGTAADDIGLQCGGWTVGWQGGTGPTTRGTTLVEGLRARSPADLTYEAAGRFADDERNRLGIICIAEEPYAEGPGDCANPTVRDEDRRAFTRMREKCDVLVLVVYSGRPLVIPDLIGQADAVIAAGLPGTEAAALADLLTGIHQFEARISQPWPRSFDGLDDSREPPLYSIRHGLVSSGIGTFGQSNDEHSTASDET